MNPLAVLRIVGPLVASLALVAMCWLAMDRFHQKHLADAAESCATAAASQDDTASLDHCLPEIRAEVLEARQARLCERALLPALRPETRFAMAQSCGAGVKRLVATGDAAAAANEALATQLADARGDITLAVERAERRAVRSTEREANGRKVIQSAPRAGGGIVCDADCLRRLGQ